jgi:hypothetical protein
MLPLLREHAILIFPIGDTLQDYFRSEISKELEGETSVELDNVDELIVDSLSLPEFSDFAR